MMSEKLVSSGNHKRRHMSAAGGRTTTCVGVVWKLSRVSAMMTTQGGRAVVSRHSSFSHLGRAHAHHDSVSGNVKASVELRVRRVRRGWGALAGAAEVRSFSAKFRCGVMGSRSGFDLSANGGKAVIALQLRVPLGFGFLLENLGNCSGPPPPPPLTNEISGYLLRLHLPFVTDAKLGCSESFVTSSE